MSKFIGKTVFPFCPEFVEVQLNSRIKRIFSWEEVAVTSYKIKMLRSHYTFIHNAFFFI